MIPAVSLRSAYYRKLGADHITGRIFGYFSVLEMFIKKQDAHVYILKVMLNTYKQYIL